MADDAPFQPDPEQFSVIAHYDPMMVAEIAMGADHPHDIAERYGVDEVDYEHLAAQPWFERLVAQKRHEFHDTGVLFTVKAAMMAESLLTRLFQQSMVGAIAAPLTVEVAKQLTDIGRLKPQPLNTLPASNGGTGFQINIQVNGSNIVAQPTGLVPAPSPDPIDVTPSFTLPYAGPAPEPAPPRPLPPDLHRPAPKPAPLPPPPAYITNLKVRDFDLRPNNPGLGALVGNPAAQAAAMGAVPTTPGPSPQHQVGLASAAITPGSKPPIS
jgi:hypothetical protein